jgi:hypothetical protein
MMDLAKVYWALAIACSEPDSDEELDEAREVLSQNYNAIVAALATAVAHDTCDK